MRIEKGLKNEKFLLHLSYLNIEFSVLLLNTVHKHFFTDIIFNVKLMSFY